MRPATLVATLASALALVGACGAPPSASPEPRTQLRPAAPEGEPMDARVEPTEPPRITGTMDADRVGPEVVEEMAADTPETAPPREARAMPGPDRRDDDGRPEWWLHEPRWSDARLTICAEALGESVRDARRAAVDAGLEHLGALLEGEAKDAEVVVTTVRPLPVPADAPGGMRYVGYVMVTVRTDQTGSSR